MAYVQKQYQGSTNAKQSPALNFKVSDQIYIKAKYFWSIQPSKKLSEKSLGLYSIITQAGTHFFTLQLPDSMKSVHPIFYVSQLEPPVPNSIPNQVQPPLPPIKVDGERKYKISEILNSKINQRKWNCNILESSLMLAVGCFNYLCYGSVRLTVS